MGEDTRKEKKKKKKQKKDNNGVGSNTTDVELNGKENTPETEEEGGIKEKKKKKRNCLYLLKQRLVTQLKAAKGKTLKQLKTRKVCKMTRKLYRRKPNSIGTR